MIEAKYVEFFGAWLAFKNGVALRTRERKIKKFKTREAALKAAEKSKIIFGW